MAASTPRGLTHPTSDDKIKDGSSPSALADDFAVLASSSDAAITAGVQEAIDDATAKYGGLPARITAVETKNTAQDSRLEKLELRNIALGANIDAMRTSDTQGPWSCSSAEVRASLVGTPPPLDVFNLEVKYVNQAAWQIARPGGNGGNQTAYERKYSPLAPVQGWTDWKPVPNDATLAALSASISALGVRSITTGMDIDAMRTSATQGDWTCSSATIRDSLLGTPPPLSVFNLEVKYVNQAAWQIARPGGNGNSQESYQRKYSPLSPYVGWTSWSRIPTEADLSAIDTESSKAPLGHRQDMLKQASKLRRAGGRALADKTAVALSFDHGFANYRDHLLPHLIRLGLPHSVAVNPGSLGAGESEGVGFAQLQDWALNHGVELVNHAVDHGDATTPEAMEIAIIGALNTLRTGCPQATIDAFIMPGVSGTGYNGFNAGLDPASWWDHPAGRMILDNHAVTTGALLGQGVPMTGNPVQSVDRAGIDTDSWATTVQNRIIELQGTGLGIHVFNHPSKINNGISASRMVSFLEFLAAERDAGRIEILTVSGFAWASTEKSRTFDLTAGKWQAGSANLTLAPLFEWARGGQWQLSVKSDTAATVTLSATDSGTGLSTSIDQEVQAGGIARLNFSIPNGASSIGFTATSTAGNLSGHQVVSI